MKKITLIVITVFTYFLSYAQTPKLSTTTIHDFAFSFYYKHHIEKNEGIRGWAYLTGNSLDYSYTDTEIAVEQLENNTAYREALFKTIYQLCKCGPELLTMQLIAIGMKATEAKHLATYIVAKHHKAIPLTEENTPQQQQVEKRTTDGDGVVNTAMGPRAVFSRPTPTETLTASDLFRFSSSVELIAHYGADNVRKQKAYGYENQDYGYEFVLFSDTDKEAILYFAGERVSSITFKKKSQWKLPYHLQVGSYLQEVIKANGVPFQINGLQVDAAGLVLNWKGGRLEDANLSIRFKSTKAVPQKTLDPFLSGFQSNTKGIEKLGLMIDEIILFHSNGK